MWERVASEEGERQRGQVHVKWKPDWRCCCRCDVDSRGEVSAGVRAILSLRRERKLTRYRDLLARSNRSCNTYCMR